MNTKIKIKKGDLVKVITGKEKGKSSTIVSLNKEKGTLTLQGLNEFKKFVKSKEEGKSTEQVTLLRPMKISNVMLVCKNCNKTTRVGLKIEGKEKFRICKKCDFKI